MTAVWDQVSAPREFSSCIYEYEPAGELICKLEQKSLRFLERGDTDQDLSYHDRVDMWFPRSQTRDLGTKFVANKRADGVRALPPKQSLDGAPNLIGGITKLPGHGPR